MTKIEITEFKITKFKKVKKFEVVTHLFQDKLLTYFQQAFQNIFELCNSEIYPDSILEPQTIFILKLQSLILLSLKLLSLRFQSMKLQSLK